MADDGLLLNFSIGSDPLRAKPNFKGGRWRDRLQAKKSVQRRQEKNPTNGALTGSNAVPTAPREALRTEADGSRPAKRRKIIDTDVKDRKSSSKPKEVISSLFTYNPSADAFVQVPFDEDTSPPKPSNAPLDDLSTFTSLGVSPFLSTHLIQHLKLKAPTAIQKAAITQLLKEDSDAFIQAETGSGKTYAYLLPIVQRIVSISNANRTSDGVDGVPSSKIHRASGLFALILAPTRELTHQISTVLTLLLRPFPWLVAGTVTGGAHKNHEKARLRKGLNILVATPGRFVDHLEHTEVLDVGSIRWLVLDEGDRLMELGFEEEIKKIMQMLNKNVGKRGVGKDIIKEMPKNRTTVLCSATMKMGVQKLGEVSLKDAVHIKVDPEQSSSPDVPTVEPKNDEESTFLTPSQLKQSFVIAPAKQRLVTLAALLKRTFMRKGSVMKTIVFLSCADSVDFHFEVFSRTKAKVRKETTPSDQNSKNSKGDYKAEQQERQPPAHQHQHAGPKASNVDLPTVSPASTLASPLNPSLTLYKLHGSLSQPIRSATLAFFTRSSEPSILLCTDVASRGLDLPNIDLVIEYDPPFSADDHLHRVGRTARAGRKGRACCFLMPGAEEGYVKVLKGGAGENSVKGEGAEEILRKGSGIHACNEKDNRGGVIDGSKWSDRATEWQLEIERQVIEDTRLGEMARKAFVSHVRAYATHVSKERGMFDVKSLHLGHLAKAFALRERPGNMGKIGASVSELSARRSFNEKRKLADSEGGEMKRTQTTNAEVPANGGGQDAVKKMRAKMEEHMTGAGEFNIG